MDDDDDSFATPLSPIDEFTDSSTDSEEDRLEKQRAVLRTYVDSLPYSCESLQEMDQKLAEIIDMIYLSASANRLDLLREWDGILSTWLLMKYPITKATRVKLLKYYYELSIIPAESHLVNERVRMFSALLPPKRDSVLSIDTNDLILDWRPLWRIVKKELWPTMRSLNPSRNVANIYLQLAELCKRFFPTVELKSILETLLPLLGPETFLSIVPVLTCFIPLSRPQDYLSALFSIWESFNSNIVDERMIELMADLAEEHVSGLAGPLGIDGAARWRDVGIWTEKQWVVITGKCLGSMNVPVGGAKGPSTTGGHADMSGTKNDIRIKKPVNKNHALAKLFVYSMSVDGPDRVDSTQDNSTHVSSTGFLAGSRALDSLEKIITSAETFFHPSNSGPWTLSLSSFLQKLASEFCKRWKEEEHPRCKTPMTQRLTPVIRRSFVLTLRTPLLFTLFAKDPIAMGFAQAALRSIALLEPGLVMPQLLERAYGGLEVVNETHRTTAVLSMLSGIALPLVSERIWLGGQRHLVPLLELCLPGIDVNDPSKTICATTFVCYALQHVKVGDLSMHAHTASVMVAGDGPSENMQTDIDEQFDRLPDGSDNLFAVLGKEEEWALVRESTAGFADWVTSLFRRVFALYENLPEEGGRRNTTGGKTEESVLKSIKNMLDVVCLHLSDPLFDLVLKLVFEYATTNTRSNAVRVIGQLVACLARVKPQLTIDTFLPYCLQQIKEELRYGASSVRTTSSHAAVPSDTTLHWNISLLRGCLGYGGAALLRHKDAILELVSVLIDKTKSERGFSGTGRLILRLLHTLSGVYPVNSRFVNSDEWQSDEFEKNHNLYWGRFYDVKDVKIEWHVPSDEEISFVLQILEQIIDPLLDNLEELLLDTSNWDDVARNDFCRYLYAIRSVWAGLPTLLQESERSGDPELRDKLISDDSIGPFGLCAQAGFCLTDQRDTRYQVAMKHRQRFGRVIHQAAVALRESVAGEDHIDAVIGVLKTKSIDTYLLEYGTSRSAYIALQKNYALVRDVNKMWPRQRENSRLVFLKRAQVYHNARLATHSNNRCRTELDVQLFDDLIEFSLSPYTRVRRHSQSALFTATASYPLAAHSVLPRIASALVRGADPDRMKGALYVLLHKNYRSVIRHNHPVMADILTALLESQHQEKPSVQKLIPTVHHEIIRHCSDEESWRDYPTLHEDTRLYAVLHSLRGIFPDRQIDDTLLCEMRITAAQRNEEKEKAYEKLVTHIIEIARRSTTHWRYLQMAMQSLPLRRDKPALADVAETLVKMTIESHPSTRLIAQRCLVKVLGLVKLRSYAKSDDEIWFEEWRNPLQQDLEVKDARNFVSSLRESLVAKKPPLVYIDKISSGFLFWEPVIKAYRPPQDSSLKTVWESQSRPALQKIESLILEPSYFSRLLSLWSQEADAKGALSTDINLRSDNMLYMKTLAKMFEEKILEKLLPELEPLLSDSNRFSQRAAAEALAGVLRGSKHWLEPARKILWDWFTPRVSVISAQIKPDTVSLWEMFFKHVLERLDPNRNRALVDWILSLSLEFHSDSAFAMSKTLSLFATLVNEMGIRFAGLSDRYINLLFDNAHTGYAEIRSGIAQALHLLMICEWNTCYASLDAFLTACENDDDPLRIRHAKYLGRIMRFAEKLPEWRLERLPPPRVSQSQFDKVSLTLLSWIWTVGHSSEASTMFAYIMPLLPEILRMTELNDNRELMMYSSGVLFILSAVTPPHEYVEKIVDQCLSVIKESSSYKIKLVGLPMLTLFFFRNLVGVSDACVERVMEIVISCLADENIEVREVAKKVLSGLLRCSQRRQILPLRDRFIATIRKTKLPGRQEPGYADALRTLHSAILGVCALMESFPYNIEPWMPALTEVLAPHSSDPPPISTTIRKTASEFKKDTWHMDQLLFNEDQLQDLSTMLIGTSYYA
ncbi:hypothetical protein ACEPAG_1009 [Sanghuangporus baumii]